LFWNVTQPPNIPQMFTSNGTTSNLKGPMTMVTRLVGGTNVNFEIASTRGENWIPQPQNKFVVESNSFGNSNALPQHTFFTLISQIDDTKRETAYTLAQEMGNIFTPFMFTTSKLI
jgi:hypothetical protein